MRWFDQLREPWRFLLFLSIAGPLVCLDTLVTWGIVALLGLWRVWWILTREGTP